jgi:hypothetical protein
MNILACFDFPLDFFVVLGLFLGAGVFIIAMFGFYLRHAFTTRSKDFGHVTIFDSEKAEDR